jgi:hypothetical protein
MANKSGSIYGLTVLSPITDDPKSEVSHNLALRTLLAKLPRHRHSPFAKLSSTHFARLVVMDDAIYVGMPACEEHLSSKYLVFESNFDGDLDSYLERMAREIPEFVNAVWKHCEGFPGTTNVAAFKSYMRACQLETTFFFADVNDKTVRQTLSALQTQSAVTAFIAKYQGAPPEELQAAFAQFLEKLNQAPPPEPAATPGHEFGDELL